MRKGKVMLAGRGSDLSQVIQIGSGGGEIKVQVCMTPELLSTIP